MKARDMVYETFSALNANRARSLLTILGVVIGIAAVIAMTALIGGIKQMLVSEMGLGQARLVNINYWGAQPLRMADVDAMAEELSDDYETVMPMNSTWTDIVSDTQKKSGTVQGVVVDYFDAMNLSFVAGGPFSQDDYDEGAMVVVMDEASAKGLFGNDDAVGRSVRIGGAEYAVRGVVEGGSQGSDMVSLYAPFSTVAQRLTSTDGIDSVYALAHSEEADMDAIAQRTTDWLQAHFGLSDEDRDNYIWIMTMKSIIDELNAMMSSFQLLMTTVASISLLVGGIGIMNMMLTNVTERIREIGLRKALGAKRGDITGQFLLESIVLTLTGGIFGVALGYVSSYALSGLATAALEVGGGTAGFTPVLEPQTVLLAAAICVGIGIVFGYYPARRAAKLDPVESLHYQ